MNRIEFKFAPSAMDAKTGEFKGYGAIFGNVDSHGDVIEPGAFKASLDSWALRSSLPAMKMMHGSAANPFTGSDMPVGKWTSMHEDEKGLIVEGKLSGMNTDRGQFHYALMQDGALSALSIGYAPVKFAKGDGTQIKRRLEVLNLKEVSLVPEGSNDLAIITDLKSWDGELPTRPQFEKFLREVGGFSISQSKAIAGKGLTPLIQREVGSTPNDEAAAYFAALGALLPA